MDLQNEQYVIIIDESQPLEIIVNTAASILASSNFPSPFCGDPRRTGTGKLYQPDFQDLTTVDVSNLVQGCKTYDELPEKMGQVAKSTLQYFGAAICGPKKKVNKLTGSIPLLR